MARSTTSKGTRYVALLRGINVGGKNKVPMVDLVAMFTEAGCGEVTTYIQSGNIVFSASASCAKRLPSAVTVAIAKKFAYQIPVVLRTAEELREVAATNPFLSSRRNRPESDSLHVAFLADEPDKARTAALDPNRSPGDSFFVRGREAYLCLPNGVARTKLTNAYFDKALGTISTVRNWRTVLTLADMVKASV